MERSVPPGQIKLRCRGLGDNRSRSPPGRSGMPGCGSRDTSCRADRPSPRSKRPPDSWPAQPCPVPPSKGPMIRPFHAFLATLSLVSATAPMAQTVTSVEYYNATLDHFFTSSLQADIDALDSGRLPGWARTGQAFGATAAAGPGLNPVCRFYIPPDKGDSHFFSAAPDECQAVLAKMASDPNYAGYFYESPAAWYTALPDRLTGTCPAGTVPVWRLWNGRVDSNHRYTANLGGARPDACAGPHARGLRPVRGGHVRTGAGADRDAGRRIRTIPVHRRLRRRRVVRHRLRRRGGRADARGRIRPIRTTSSVSGSRTAGRTAAHGARHRRLAGRRAHLDAGRGRVFPLHRRQRNQRRRLRARDAIRG